MNDLFEDLVKNAPITKEKELMAAKPIQTYPFRDVQYFRTREEKLSQLDEAVFWLNSYLNQPVATIDPIKRFGSVLVVEYTLYQKEDPRVPVVQKGYNKTYSKLFRQFCSSLEDWADYKDQKHWTRNMQQLVFDLAKLLDLNPYLCAAEADFCLTEMRLSISNPHQKDYSKDWK